MEKARLGDYPLIDLLFYGGHPFPRDMEKMILELHRWDPGALRSSELDFIAWKNGLKLNEGRAALRAKLRGQ